MAAKSEDRIRELQQKISEWEGEQSVTIQRERDDQQARSDTLMLSSWIVAIGVIPSKVWIAYWIVSIYPNESLLGQILSICFALILFGVIAAGAARASGLAAHWRFRRTKNLERLAAVIIALCADMLLFWWVLVLTNWHAWPF